MSSTDGAPQVTRAALVGLGWAGRSLWLPRLTAHPAYRVTAVVEPGPGAAESVPAGAALLASADDLDPAQTDLAVVAVPNHLHTPVVTGLLERGIAVFLEKPVCLTVAEADRLAAAERDGGAVLLAGSAARYRGDVRALRDLVGRLGPVRHLELSWVRAGGVPAAGGWFTSRRLSGGGALVDLGWHLLDTVGALLDADVSYPYALGAVSSDFVNNASRQAGWRADEQDGAERGDVEDTARGFLVTDTGVSVALRAAWASHEQLDTTRITVEGAAGTATLTCTFGFSPNRHPRPVLTLTRDGETVEVPLPHEPIGAEYDRQVAELPVLAADPAARGAAAAHARSTIAVIERLYASAAAARPAARGPAVAGNGDGGSWRDAGPRSETGRGDDSPAGAAGAARAGGSGGPGGRTGTAEQAGCTGRAGSTERSGSAEQADRTPSSVPFAPAVPSAARRTR